MNVRDALRCLGATKVVWIDDHFSETAAQLASMFAGNVHNLRNCGIIEFSTALERHEFEPDETQQRLEQALTDMGTERRAAVKAVFQKADVAIEGGKVDELTEAAIARACDLLGIEPDNRWTFDGVEEKVRRSVRGGDKDVSYIVDLKDKGGGGVGAGPALDRGLDILRLLAAENSLGTAFILTHEADTDGESRTERKLHDSLAPQDAVDVPVCVISKQRLAGEDPGAEVMEEAFRVAIKRAGLLRSVHEVMRRAAPEVGRSFAEARVRLLRIPPEKLDRHVVERGYGEGLSELHVIERTLTAYMSQGLRTLFVKDEEVRANSERLRLLRGIVLTTELKGPDRDLEAFRNAETWEDGDLINASHSPLTSGDVFAVDTGEEGTAKVQKRFILLGQACDLSLRPEGMREARTALLVPLKGKPADTQEKSSYKEHMFPCVLASERLVADLREATPVDLSILDLATFRPDGIVRFDEGQAMPKGLLPGQEAIHADRTVWLAAYVKASMERSQAVDAALATARALADAKVPAAPLPDAEPGPEAGLASSPAIARDSDGEAAGPQGASHVEPQAADPGPEPDLRTAIEAIAEAYRAAAEVREAAVRRLHLTLVPPEDFRHVAAGRFEPERRWRENKKSYVLPPRVTWRLVRAGRIREPFATGALDMYLRMVGRPAHEVEYLLTPPPAPPPRQAPGEPVPLVPGRALSKVG